MRLVLRLITSFLAGVIAVGGFHPFEYWFLPPTSLLLSILILRGVGIRWRILGFYFYGLGFLFPLLHWSSTYVGALPWIVLSLGFALFYSLLAFGIRDNQVRPILFTLIFIASESLRSLLPFGGFGWGRYGFSQLDGPFSQWLRIGGVALTGGVVALAASLLGSKRVNWFWLLPLVTIGLFAPLNASALSNENIRVGLIQGGVSQLGLDFNATPREVLNRHLDETQELLSESQVDLIIWPENASDIDPLVDQEVRARIEQIVSDYQTPMVIGAVLQGMNGPENVSILFERDQSVPSIYQKRDLVPFGEYVPLRNFAKRFSGLVDEVSDFSPGTEIVSHRVSGLSFAPLICYEILDDRVAWENLSHSSIGVVQTNNATFGRSWQSGQQFQMTRIRAFESRIPFVVAATTGDTAYINGDGRVIDRLPKYQQSHAIVSVSKSQPSIPPIAPEFVLSASLILFSMLSFRDVRSFVRHYNRTEPNDDLILT